MFVSHQREKLLSAIIYFIANTRRCHTLKLFKLLYFLDFEHFRQTGQSVTGLRYVAWPMGPAPAQLWHELDAPQPDLAAAVSVTRQTGRGASSDLDAQATRDSWDARDFGYPTPEEPSLGRRTGGEWSGPPRRDIRAKRKFDSRHFTKRELKIMKWLVEVFKETLAGDMTEVTHSSQMPWGKIYAGGEGRGQEIPYEISLESAVLIEDHPSLSDEEYEHRKRAFAEVEQHTD